MTFALMLALPVVALADITLDTSATLATDANLPTSVEVGENTFTIKVWRDSGNVGNSKTGEFSIVNEYNMDANGTITPDSTKVSNFDWSDLSCSGSTPPQGCSATNPATINAKLIVAAGAQGKTGQLQISQIAVSATSGIVTDPSPASGFVQVAGKAPGSVSINNIPNDATFGGSFTPSYTKAGDGAASVSSLTSATCTVSGGVVSFAGAGVCTLQAKVAEGTNHLAATGSQQSFNIGYQFIGFASPVDNTNSYMNVLKAGQAIPLKWRLLDANNQPVPNLSGVTVTAKTLSCDLQVTQDLMEEVAAGGSGLQNLGNGYYQFNWASPKSYANSCKTLHLALGEGKNATGNPVTHTAQFRFTK
jgi:hypothetical protein